MSVTVMFTLESHGDLPQAVGNEAVAPELSEVDSHELVRSMGHRRRGVRAWSPGPRRRPGATLFGADGVIEAEPSAELADHGVVVGAVEGQRVDLGEESAVGGGVDTGVGVVSSAPCPVSVSVSRRAQQSLC
jgi:hypothetical protein